MNEQGRPIKVHGVRRSFLVDLPLFDFFFFSMSPFQLALTGACIALSIRVHSPIPLIAALPASRLKLEHFQALRDWVKARENKDRRTKRRATKPKKAIKIVGTLRSPEGETLPYRAFTVFNGERFVSKGLTDSRGRYAFYYRGEVDELRIVPDKGEFVARVRGKTNSLSAIG